MSTCEQLANEPDCDIVVVFFVGMADITSMYGFTQHLRYGQNVVQGQFLSGVQLVLDLEFSFF